MTITATIKTPTGNDLVFKSMANIEGNTEVGIDIALFKAGKDIKTAFEQEVLANNKAGNIYILRGPSGSRIRHIASAPGQTAANISGNYRREFGTINRSAELVVCNSADYAGFLELGTSRMKARPGLSNSIHANQRNLMNHLATDISNTI